MNLFVGMKRLFIVLAVPGIPLLAAFGYFDAQAQCSANQGHRFYELVGEKVTGDADRMALYSRHLGAVLSSSSLDYRVDIAVDRKILPAMEIQELRKQVERERDGLCRGIGTRMAGELAVIVAAVLALFAALYGFIRITSWVIAGFRRSS